MRWRWIALLAFACGRIDSPAARATFIAAGDRYACAILGDATVECWGINDHGQLGNGTTDELCTENVGAPQCSLLPTHVVGLDHVVQLGAGEFHACALRDDGVVLCWGDNLWGSLGDGTGIDRDVPVPVVGLPDSVAEVQCGGGTTCVRTSLGEVWCWGIDYALPVDPNNGPQHHVDARKVDGVANAVQLSVGFSNVCARIADGHVQCWGSGSTCENFVLGGQIVAPPPFVPGVVNAVDVSTHGDASAIVRADGTLLVGAGCDNTFDAAVARVTDAVHVSASGTTICYIDRGGSGHCINGFEGSRGDGLRNQVFDHFTDVSGFPDLLEMTTSEDTCAVDTHGNARCWGWNASGEVGDGTTTERDLPTPVLLAP